MFNQQSPLETLASYAVSFGAGVLSVAAVTLYGRWMQRRGARAASPNREA
jgi:Na+/proline symporter